MTRATVRPAPGDGRPVWPLPLADPAASSGTATFEVFAMPDAIVRSPIADGRDEVLATAEKESLVDLLRQLLIHFQDLIGPSRHREREES